MADELEKNENQFAGEDMSAIIGEPVTNKQEEERTMTFSYNRPVVSEDGTITGTEEVTIDVPILSIVKIPSLKIDETDIAFDMEVRSSAPLEDISDKQGSLGKDGVVNIGHFGFNVKINGSIVRSGGKTRKTDNTAKYHIQVHANGSKTREGLEKMLDIMESVCSSDIGDSEKEGE